MPSFGYTASGGGGGLNVGVAFYSAAATVPNVFASQFANLSGSPIWVDTATLLNVVNAGASGARVAIYDSQDWPGGAAMALRGVSDLKTPLNTGSVVFNFSTPILVDQGARVWVVLLAANTGTIACDGAALLSATGILEHFNPTGAPPNPYPLSGWDRSGVVLPINLSGSSSGTLPATDLRAALAVNEPLIEGDPFARVALAANEPLTEGDPFARAALALNEPLTEGDAFVRAPLVVLEALIEIPDEGEMATELFPNDLGRAWQAHKSPTYNTQVRSSTSLRTVRNSLTQFPAWDFEVSFPWLPGTTSFMSSTSDPDLDRIAGFFKRMRGQGKSFLFPDPKDYRARGQVQGLGDAVTTEFRFVARVMGDEEPVGQVDMLLRFLIGPGDVNPATDQISRSGAGAHDLATGDGPFFVSSTGALPAGLAALTPYWAIADTPTALRLAASRADALAGTAINLTSSGSGAHSLVGGWAVYADGVLQTGVTFTAPNRFVFAVAPALDAVITADFDYLFVCHFLQDVADFEQFAGDLYMLNQVRFRADPGA